MLANTMFGSLTKGYNVGPTAEELKKQAEEAQRISKVNFNEYKVKIYFLNVPEDVEAYREDMKMLIDGLGKRTHVLFHNDRQFLADKQTWIISLEWGEFELMTEDIAPVRSV